MAATIKPIAPLTDDDHGPINTIVSIVLITITILFTSIRLVIRQQKLLRLDADDFAFGVALCFGITASVVSHYCVRAGLGRHQDQLGEFQAERYFELFWTTQFLNIIALASAKLSIVLIFRRIDPVQLGPPTFKWLIPMVTVYTVVTLFLIGFQCQLPRPWILSPKNCSTHGNVYYATTIFNILTDAALALWLLPAVWHLSMKKNTKYIVMTLFGSRFAVCVADIGRMVVIQKALQSEDQTWSHLLWAIMDQFVVHLSINHATLPRVHVFLSNLQTGLLVTRITATQNGTQSSKTPNSNSNSKNSRKSRRSRMMRQSIHTYDDDDGIILHSPVTRTDREGTGRRLSKTWNELMTLPKMGFRLSKTPSISEHPLRLQPEQGIELSTTVYTGQRESVSKASSAPDAPKGISSSMSVPPREIIRREDNEAATGLGGVRVQKEINVAVNRI